MQSQKWKCRDLALYFPNLKPAAALKGGKREHQKSNTCLGNYFLFSVGCLTLLHSVRSYFAHVVYSVKALESRIEIVTITAKLLQHNE